MKHTTLITAATLCLSLAGCFGTPVARRQVTVEQQQGSPFLSGPIQIDTSAMRPDDCTVHYGSDRYGPATTVLIDGGVPVRIVILPANTSAISPVER
jgi:hypothetical protein